LDRIPDIGHGGYELHRGWVIACTRARAGLAELTITNSGELIPPDETAALFEPFRRLPAAADSRPGTGLGLSIVASVARAHGGRAQARARPDGGLEVQVTLPAAAPHASNTTFSASSRR
jgi:signal transduction histidine kinase